MPKPKLDEICTATHDPGIWPYTARCVLPNRHKNPVHIDRHGNTWKSLSDRERKDVKRHENLISRAKAEHDKVCQCDPKYLASCSKMAAAVLGLAPRKTGGE